MSHEQDVRHSVIEQLKTLARQALHRVEVLVSDEEWDQAIGALSAVDYVLRSAGEWK